MKAILQEKFGGSETLYLGETEIPKLKEREVLVRVKSTALNRADISQREGKYPPPKGESEILGLECSGTIEDSNGSNWKVGDEIMTLLPGGAYAEFVAVHQNMLMPKPQNLTFEEATAIPEAFLTAWQALVRIGEIMPGQHILIHAGASGVGNAAIQLAKQIGATIFTTCSESKVNFCVDSGAKHVINYQKEDFSEVIKQKTSNEGVHLIIDFIGGDYLEKNIQCLAKDGKIIQLATMGGASTQIDLRKLMAKRGQLIASTLRSRTRDYQIKLTQDFWKFAERLFLNGTLKPVVDSVFYWNEVREAHKYMEANRNKGKIVLRVS
ncbi:NAD(P)H-quinone oxidoreductase [bacterium]|nr:MAG: NAD(P)H-quinone oxidoreductase [bacterium]